jgi:phosphoglycerate kinase
MKSIRDLSLAGRKLFLRVDYNVPLENGRVSDDTRIVETLPTLRLAIERGARVICASHLGKAKGKPKPELSLAPVAVRFAERLQRPVLFVDDCVGPEAARAANALAPGEVLLLENLRFHAGEEANDPEFAKALASLADVYVDDAFGAAHRVHASVVGVPKLLKEKGAGLLLEKEVRELSRLLEPERPFAAILGGAKISGKIDTLHVLARRADVLLVGGGMANHFVRALGLPVGRSLLEEDKVALAREILDF